MATQIPSHATIADIRGMLDAKRTTRTQALKFLDSRALRDTASGRRAAAEAKRIRNGHSGAKRATATQMGYGPVETAAKAAVVAERVDSARKVAAQAAYRLAYNGAADGMRQRAGRAAYRAVIGA